MLQYVIYYYFLIAILFILLDPAFKISSELIVFALIVYLNLARSTDTY